MVKRTKAALLITAGIIVALLLGIGVTVAMARLFHRAVTDVRMTHASPLALPTSSEETDPDGPEIVLRLRADGTILSGAEILNDQALEARLTDRAANDPATIVRLRVNPAASQEDVIRILEACTRAGLVKVLFVDEPDDDAN